MAKLKKTHGKAQSSLQHKYKIIKSSKLKAQLQELRLHKSSKKNNSKENNECKDFFYQHNKCKDNET